MKRYIFSFLLAGVLVALVGVLASPLSISVSANGKGKGQVEKDTCTTIQSGELLTSDGGTITTGYDEWGYNYQARIFNGKYCDAYRNADWCQPWKEDNLMMKWNDAWMSNKDCSGDGKLDRHYGHDSYIGSGAWLTNHQSGEYVVEDDEYQVYQLAQKNPSNWEVVTEGASGEMVYGYNDFTFEAEKLNPYTNYSLIYYPDPWPGTGCMILGEGAANEFGHLELIGDFDFSYIPIGEDENSDFKIWLVPTADFSCPEGLNAWNPEDYLFDNGISPLEVTYSWNYFVKIVAVPEDAKNIDGYWFSADGTVIGSVIWGQFAIIQEIENDPGAGLHGVSYKSPSPVGLGYYK